MDFTLLKQLCETPGVPSQEEPIRALVREVMAPLVDSVEVDIMGNVIGLKRGEGKRKVMIAAHIDEIGFLVRYIDDKGFVRLQPLGGFDPRQLFAQRVQLRTRSGETLRGVLAYSTKPPHLMTPEEQNKPPQIESFFVDLGMSAEEVKAKVSVGDMVTMDRTTEMNGDVLFGKAMDDRVGVFVMLETLRALQGQQLGVDLYAVATVQEEVGLRGATTAAYAIEPDIGIALDVTIANDYPGSTDTDTVTKLGKGVAIKIMDSSLICHPKLVEHFRQIAEREQIPYQMEILPRGGTDAGALQRSRGGTASITISIPTRYVHTVNEMVHRKDIEAAVQLLSHYLQEAHTGDYRF